MPRSLEFARNDANAFTLAETLITLVIVGVIAALTVPNLYNRYQENVTVEKVKKFYSTLSNAVRLAISDNGGVHTWDYGDGLGSVHSELTNKKFWSYIKPYILTSKDNCNQTGDCIYSGYIKRLNGDDWGNYSGSGYYKIVLNDGSIFWFRTDGDHCNNSDGTDNKNCAYFWYDVNGSRKPNTMGKDVFIFWVYPYKVIPHPGFDCKKQYDGWSCAKYILEHGNMNYLH